MTIKTTYQTITALAKQDDDTLRVTGTGLGTGHPGVASDVYQLTGVGGFEIFEGLNLSLDATVDANSFDLTGFAAAGLVCPDVSSWTTGGAIRYQPASYLPAYAGSMRAIFGHQTVDSITTTGSTADEFKIGNALNNNRGEVHQAAGGSNHNFNATLPVGSLVTAVALLDRLGEDDALVQIEGFGPSGDTVDVVYPYKALRYAEDEAPGSGFTQDTTKHFIAYIPPIEAQTDTGSDEDQIKITVINPSGGTADLEFSQLILADYWTPSEPRAANYNFGSKVGLEPITKDSLRGGFIQSQYFGVDKTRTVAISNMDEYAASMIELLILTKQNVIFDSRPMANGERWRTMAVGRVTGATEIEGLRGGNAVELTIMDTRLHEGI